MTTNKSNNEDIILHVCCGPCALNVINELKSDYNITLYFYNPNIFPENEYIKRKKQIKEYAVEKNIPFLDEDYKPDEFYSAVKGMEHTPEGGERCSCCFDFRLKMTAKKCLDLNIKVFTTTLTVSPHKNSKTIFRIANKTAEKFNLNFLEKNFKKMNGFKKTIELAKKNNFYIQNYCGCKYSLKERENRLSINKK